MSLEDEIIPGSPEKEVKAKESRRRFSAADKRRIVEAAAACTQPGELTALLRKEGVYWSYLRRWREDYTRDSVALRKRGPKPMTPAQKADRARVRETRAFGQPGLNGGRLVSCVTGLSNRSAWRWRPYWMGAS